MTSGVVFSTEFIIHSVTKPIVPFFVWWTFLRLRRVARQIFRRKFNLAWQLPIVSYLLCIVFTVRFMIENCSSQVHPMGSLQSWAVVRSTAVWSDDLCIVSVYQMMDSGSSVEVIILGFDHVEQSADNSSSFYLKLSSLYVPRPRPGDQWENIDCE